MKSQKRILSVLMALVMLLTLMPIATLGTSAEDPTYYLDYTINDGKVTITGVRNDPVNLVVPATIEGYPVTEIGLNFMNDMQVNAISFPDGLERISIGYLENTDFYNNPANWQDDVLYIGDYLIVAKTTLSGRYEVRPGTKLIADYAFSGCGLLEELVIPASVPVIPLAMCKGCLNLYKVKLHHGITYIPESAFTYCKFSGTVVFPDTITYIGAWVFSPYPHIPSDPLPNQIEHFYFFNPDCVLDNTDPHNTFINTAVFHGYAGSTAEQYANAYGYAFVPFTDCPIHEDDDHNDICDNCGESMAEEHIDADHDHHCDNCDEVLSECIDEDNDFYCDICGAKLKRSLKDIIAYLDTLTMDDVDFNHDFFCKMCPLYFAHRDTEIIGPFIRLIHNFVHMAHFIGYIS